MAYPPPPTGPAKIDYVDGMEIPPDYHLEERTRTGLAIGGGITFGATWLLSALTGATLSDVWDNDDDIGNDDTAWPLFVPVAGPFIGIGTMDPSTAGTFFLVMDGLVQTGGLAMFIAGFAAPKKVLVHDDYYGYRLEVAPRLGANGTGLVLSGAM